ncbi:MAG: gliding motility-associatede transport system auxiliary component [Myxococcales bacterium]|nr:gliding motility-associatede transport system auxiliary component [Myxococcales bacterium]
MPSDSTNQGKKRVSASNALMYAMFVVGAIVVVNLLGTRVFGRLDLTENKVYTLSPASKDVVRNLPDYMTVKAFISKDLPPELSNISRYVRDLLDEYRTYSKGKLRFEALDPGADKKIEEEATACKVNKLQVQVMRSQKFEVGAYYLGLCFQYNGQNEAIPEVAQAEGMEYQISSLIKRMTQKKRKVAFSNGHGELDLSQGFQALKNAVGQEYESMSVNPSTTPIPDDVDALVVGGPKQAFDEKGRKEIDKFLMKGKGAIFLVDGMVMSQPRGGAEIPGMPKVGQANDSGLTELLAAYGFKVGNDFVLDKQNAPGPVDFGGRRMLANKEVFVGVEVQEPKNQKELPLIGGIKALVFPYASSVELVGPLKDGKAERGKLWTIATSSPTSWKASGFFFFSPNTKLEETKDKGPFNLAFAYQGTLKSAYPSTTPPPAAAGMSAPPDPSATPLESAKPARLLVVGDSDFASDEYVQLARYMPLYQNGAQLLFNAIAWTLEDEALTPVRAKTITARPIQIESEQKVALAKWGNIFGLPFLFCAFGILRWRVRRSNRQGQKL